MVFHRLIPSVQDWLAIAKNVRLLAFTKYNVKNNQPIIKTAQKLRLRRSRVYLVSVNCVMNSIWVSISQMRVLTFTTETDCPVFSRTHSSVVQVKTHRSEMKNKNDKKFRISAFWYILSNPHWHGRSEIKTIFVSNTYALWKNIFICQGNSTIRG